MWRSLDDAFTLLPVIAVNVELPKEAMNSEDTLREGGFGHWLPNSEDKLKVDELPHWLPTLNNWGILHVLIHSRRIYEDFPDAMY
jgi:hypothetical protein